MGLLNPGGGEPNVLDLLLDGLATYRLARLLVKDEGPGGIFLRLRVLVGAHDRGENGLALTNLGRAFNCLHCLGVYAALAVLLLRPFPALRNLLAVAGLASVLATRE